MDIAADIRPTATMPDSNDNGHPNQESFSLSFGLNLMRNEIYFPKYCLFFFEESPHNEKALDTYCVSYFECDLLN